MGCLGRATCTVHLISAPGQPGRKRMYHYILEKLRAYCSNIYCDSEQSKPWDLTEWVKSKFSLKRDSWDIRYSFILADPWLIKHWFLPNRYLVLTCKFKFCCLWSFNQSSRKIVLSNWYGEETDKSLFFCHILTIRESYVTCFK